MSLAFKNHPLYNEELSTILATKGIEQLKKKTILITGSTGLVGTQMIDALMKYNSQGADVTIVAIGRDESRAQERLGEYFNSPLFHFIKHDVVDAFPDSLHADFIVPLASTTHPMAYSQHPIATIMTNLQGANHALRLAERENATVVYPSTVEIYGNAITDEPFKEDMTGQLNLSTSRACYTEVKRTCEALCQSFICEKGVNVKIARLCRVFGPTVLPDDSKASSQFIRKALANEDIVLKSEGRQLFSYIYTADAVSALLYIMLNGERGVAYNVSNDACNVLLKYFAQAYADAVGRNVVVDSPTLVEQQGYSVATKAILDNSRLRALGWSPRYNLHEAVAHTLTLLKA